MNELHPAQKLTWLEAAELVQNLVEDVLHKEISCKMRWEDDSYWTLYSDTYKFSLHELEQLLRSVPATKTTWEETIPQEGTGCRSVGMELSRLMLKQVLHGDWVHEYCTEEAIWLLDFHSCVSESPLTPTLQLPGVRVALKDLKSQNDLLAYLKKHGSTHTSLMEFCEEYQETYHNDLCWPYPISDGVHMGTYLIPVKEGILSLPYDCVDSEDYEVFLPEDACLCDANAMQIFLEEWNSFSTALCQAMENMAWTLRILRKTKQVGF